MPMKQTTINTLITKHRPTVFVETGTHKGDGVQQALDAGFIHAFSTEVNPQLHTACVERFANDTRVTLHKGDSAAVLSAILAEVHCPALFWLDAHEGRGAPNACPVLQELAVIAKHDIKGHVILVDDVRLFGTPKFNGITLAQVKAAITAIDPAYAFRLEDSAKVGKDILVAELPPKHQNPIKARLLTEEQLHMCNNRIISAEALAMIVLHRIAADESMSIIRMADGERAIIDKAQGLTNDPHGKFLMNDAWLTRYGMLGMDIEKLGEQLLTAGRQADYLAVAISGLVLGNYNVHQYFPKRKFIDQWYHREWASTGRVTEILSAAPVMYCQRDAVTRAGRISNNFNVPPIEACTLNSWRDHDRIRKAVAKTKAKIIILSGGPGAKPLNVELAKKYNKIVIDGGQEAVARWAR